MATWHHLTDPHTDHNFAPEPSLNLPSVTVVICAYTESRWVDLCAALDSLRTQTWPAQQQVLVIDHNPHLLSRAVNAFSQADVVENMGEKGLAGARNTGVELSRNEIVAFLDDDAVPHPNWIEELVRPYLDDAIQGTGGVARANWIEGAPKWFPSEFNWVVGCSYRGLPSEVAPIRNPIGAAMSFRRSVFSQIGGFNSEVGRVATIPLGCEETLLGIRVLQHYGYGSILHIPTAVVDHTVGPERKSIHYMARRCFAEGISKASVAKLVGPSDASSAERAYVSRVLPGRLKQEALRLMRGDLQGAAVSSAVLVGLLLTTIGYGLGRAGLSGPITRWLVGRTEQSPDIGKRIASPWQRLRNRT